MVESKYKISFKNNQQDLRTIALFLLVVCFVIFNITPQLNTFIFITFAAIINLYLVNKWILKTTPTHGFLLLDCENNYVEIHTDRLVTGQIVAAELMFSVLSLKIKAPLSHCETVNFVASSMPEQDWKRLCGVVLNEKKKER